MRVTHRILNLTFLILFFGFGSTISWADDEDHLLHVVGIGESTVLAKRAEVRLDVEVTSQSVQTIHNQLSERNQKVLEALRKKGAQKLTTTQMSIFPQYDHKQGNKVIGYRGNMAILFHANTDDVGPMIDAALQAGANRMNGFSLIADEKELEAANHEAYKVAAKNAMTQAKIILDALNLEMDGIYEISIGGQPPIMHKQYRAMATMDAAASQTEITPGEQKIQAIINLKVQFKAKDY